ncbi:MAG: cold-shock protein [Acidimicrobiales bacterium]
MLTGRVTAFDERRGDGELLSDDGDALYFHCVAIADGSRTIAVGTLVTAERAVGRRGRDEAVHLVRQMTD